MIQRYFKKMVRGLLPRTIHDALIEYRLSRLPIIPDYESYAKYVQAKNGIEIGGPSVLFKTTLPIYQIINSLDGVNFSHSTVWEGSIKAGLNFNFFKGKSGSQFISDGTDLSQIPSNSYDFLLSSNCLEHIANPIKALHEWKRILKKDGALLLILPNKESNFDRKRSVTTFEHILNDFNNNTSEYDLTHLDEILELHDLSMDPPAGSFDKFKSRSLDNFNNRTLHHHVFDINLMRNMFNFLKMEIIQENTTDKDLLMLAIK